MQARIQAIAALETALQKNPNEWLFWWILADMYSRMGNISGVVRSALRAWGLRPDDPRTVFGAGSALLLLADVGDAEEQKTAVAQRMRAEKLGILKELESTPDEAARKAMGFFVQALDMGLPSEDVMEVRGWVHTLHQRFPNLSRGG